MSEDERSASPLLQTRAGPVRVLTLNRPANRNALDRSLFDALIAAFAELDADPECAVAVLTGVDPAFCAGADLADAADAELVAQRRASNRNPITALLEVRTPVIGAINGFCVTGGLELALACDFLIASERARFADTHVQLGMVHGWGGAALLPEAIGRRRAKELALTGRWVPASEALELGLVARVVAHEELLAETIATAERVARAPAAKAAAMLRIMDAGVGRDLDGRMSIEREIRELSPVDVTAAAAARRRAEYPNSRA